MNKLRATFAWIVLLLGTLACGVMAGCSTEILPPTAVVTADPTTVAVGAAVRLDGSTSTDPQDLPLYYRWSLAAVPPGSSATLIGPDAPKPSFVADLPGDYVVELTVSNGTVTGEKATATIKAGPCGTNLPVVESVAAKPTAASVGEAVTVSAVVTDADIDAPCGLARVLSRAWTLSKVPPGSGASLTVSGLEEPFFVPDLQGDYTVTLVVTDELGRKSEPKSVDVAVTDCSENVPVIDSVTPSTASPVVGQVVQLMAAISDADTLAPCNLPESISYAWTLVGQPAGSTVVLNNPLAAGPSFAPDLEGDYSIKLVVTDAKGHESAAVTTTITAATCGGAAPTAILQELVPEMAGPASAVIGPDVGVNHIVQLSATGSTDADSAPPCSLPQTLSYEWSFLALPAGSSAKINDTTIVNPSFSTDYAGTYVVGLVVTDSTGKKSAQATFTITADPSIGIGVPSGFTISTVATWPDIDAPRGLTKDGAGNIYLVQGDASLQRIAPDGKVNTLTKGGFLNSPQDVVFEPGSSQLFVTGGGGVIAKVDLGGLQTACVDDGAASFRGIDFFNGSGGPRIFSGDQFGNRAIFYDPATCTQQSTNNFGGGLDNPWGVTAAVIGGADVVYLTDASADIVRRNTGGAYATNAGTNVLISNNFLLGNARDVVTTPCPTPKLIVANRDGANLLLFSDTANTVPSVMSTGYQAPIGLRFEDANNLLVTDEAIDSVFRITGNFCSL